MNEQNIFYTVILDRFFHEFQSITYHGVPICKFVYYAIIKNWTLELAKENPVYFKNLQDEMNRLRDSETYDRLDEPYIYEPHPDGIILMRGGFGDLASLFLPKERFFLISPNQGEVNIIGQNLPGFPAHNIQDYFRENPKAVQSLNQRFTQKFAGLKDDPLLGNPKLQEWFQQTMPAIVSMLDAVQSLFENLRVGTVLTIASAYSMDGALNLIARANRIPSLTVQHGILDECNLLYNFPILATKKAVWGSAIRNLYQKFGVPESRIAVVGSPRFDIILNQKWWGKAKLCQMLQIDPAKKVVVYAAQIFHFAQTVTPVILEGLQSIPDLFLLILLHPGENPVPHEELAKGYPNCKVIRFGHVSLYNALSGADCFITYYSTSAFEAMYFQLPVITVEPMPPKFSFGDLGVSLKVENSVELRKILIRLFSEEAFRLNAVNRYQKFIASYCIPDGLASKRLFDEVDLLCRTGGTV
ncbi:MAG TPA: hypothetical protein DDW50_03450 [Firmicutes bacterium]|jgi:hypothetical protein|nr:hypothetical protein [Bacillota bacterium]